MAELARPEAPTSAPDTRGPAPDGRLGYRSMRPRNSTERGECPTVRDPSGPPIFLDGSGNRVEVAHEIAHVTEVLVAFGVGVQPRQVGVETGPAKRRFGEQDVGPPSDAVLEQPVREDDVDPGRLASVV